jgi:WXG100 family type VII secretion target
MTALNTDLDLMTTVAARIDSGNGELRALLQSFIGRMTGVPSTVWGGAAATRFRDVVDRWNAESAQLHTALERIAETLRANQQTLHVAAEQHSHQIAATAGSL